jgi:hypothetical protein
MAGCHQTFDFLSTVESSIASDTYLGGWKLYLQLCLRPYWKRIWVLQEIIRARRVTDVCIRGITWQKFTGVRMAHKFSTTEELVLLHGQHVRPARLLPIFRQVVESLPHSIAQLTSRDNEHSPLTSHGFIPLSLLYTVTNFHTSECSEPR